MSTAFKTLQKRNRKQMMRGEDSSEQSEEAEEAVERKVQKTDSGAESGSEEQSEIVEEADGSVEDAKGEEEAEPVPVDVFENNLRAF